MLERSQTNVMISCRVRPKLMILVARHDGAVCEPWSMLAAAAHTTASSSSSRSVGWLHLQGVPRQQRATQRPPRVIADADSCSVTFTSKWCSASSPQQGHGPGQLVDSV
jgi:hypothetical protein